MSRPLLFAALLALPACAPGGTPAVAHLDEPTRIAARGADGPPDAAPGTCWGRDETPARLQTVVSDVVITPATTGPDGAVVAPAQTRTETRQEIVEERRELWFETACPDTLTPDTIASLQRALAARGYYDGAITGDLDTATRSAIRRFQQPLGLDSSVLSLAAARALGLAPVAQPVRPGR